jgi:DNA polymerase-3 subunit alpha
MAEMSSWTATLPRLAAARSIAACVKNGFPEDKAGKIFDLIAYFAGYGFNRSHSVAYALIAYQTAYLKAHYPREFMASLITSDMDNTDKVMRYIGECRDLGCKVLPPDINEGFAGFTVSGENIRFGLGAIKGVGQAAITSVVEERQSNGTFESFADLCERLDYRQVNKKVVESLIKGGALDSLGMHRADMAGNMGRVMEWAQREQEDRQQGQISLFGGGSAPAAATMLSLQSMPVWSDSESLAYEKEALGFYISSHPLMAVQTHLQRLTNVTSQTLTEVHGDQLVTIGGVITQQRTQLTKKGDRMGCPAAAPHFATKAASRSFTRIWKRCLERRARIFKAQPYASFTIRGWRIAAVARR